MNPGSAPDRELRAWKKSSIVLGVIVAVLMSITLLTTVMSLAMKLALGPTNRRIEALAEKTMQAQRDESQSRAEGDSLIGLQIITVTRVISEPDPKVRKVLLERVKELSPSGTR